MKQNGKEYVWMVVTEDEYELPLVIAESPTELAKIIGTKPDTIRSCYSHYKNGRVKHCKFRKVEV